jgi:hypothetical protein
MSVMDAESMRMVMMMKYASVRALIARPGGGAKFDRVMQAMIYGGVNDGDQAALADPAIAPFLAEMSSDGDRLQSEATERLKTSTAMENIPVCIDTLFVRCNCAANVLCCAVGEVMKCLTTVVKGDDIKTVVALCRALFVEGIKTKPGKFERFVLSPFFHG